MKKLLIMCAFAFATTGCDIPDVPVTREDIDIMEAKLDQCVSNLEIAQAYLIELADDLQECIDKKEE
jgi:hypothetical protein